MANERDDEKIGENQGSGNRSPQSETGKQNEQTQGRGEQPAASGQGDTTGEDSDGPESTQPSGGTLTADQEKDQGERGGSNPTGEGFVGSQGKDSSEYLQEKSKADSEGTSDKPPLDGE